MLALGANIGLKNNSGEAPIAGILPSTMETFLNTSCLKVRFLISQISVIIFHFSRMAIQPTKTSRSPSTTAFSPHLGERNWRRLSGKRRNRKTILRRPRRTCCGTWLDPTITGTFSSIPSSPASLLSSGQGSTTTTTPTSSALLSSLPSSLPTSSPTMVVSHSMFHLLAAAQMSTPPPP